ncbi:hypothetical protein NB704_004378 [Pantoea ananatis]|nr:hypothetical protein [Pantoea ananatis]
MVVHAEKFMVFQVAGVRDGRVAAQIVRAGAQNQLQWAEFAVHQVLTFDASAAQNQVIELRGVAVKVRSLPGVKEDLNAGVRLCEVIHPFVCQKFTHDGRSSQPHGAPDFIFWITDLLKQQIKGRGDITGVPEGSLSRFRQAHAGMCAGKKRDVQILLKPADRLTGGRRTDVKLPGHFRKAARLGGADKNQPVTHATVVVSVHFILLFIQSRNGRHAGLGGGWLQIF